MAITLGLALRVDHTPATVLQPEQALRRMPPVLNITPMVDSVMSSPRDMRNTSSFRESQSQTGPAFLTYSQRGEGQVDAVTGRNINIFA